MLQKESTKVVLIYPELEKKCTVKLKFENQNVREKNYIYGKKTLRLYSYKLQPPPHCTQ